MRFNLLRSPHQFLRSLFMTMLLLTVLTLSITSIVLYVNFERIALKQTYASDASNLSQISRDATIMVSAAYRMAHQIYRDPSVGGFLFYPDPDPIELSGALNQLANYKESMPYIESIYAYNGSTKTIASSRLSGNSQIQLVDEFEDQDFLQLFNRTSELESLKPIPRRVAYRKSDLVTYSNYYTFLYFGSPGHPNPENSMVVLNLSETWLHKIISSQFAQNDSNIFIMDEDNTLISATWKHDMLKNLSSYPFVQQMNGAPLTDGYFIDTVDGVSSLVTYTAPDSFGWRYIKITPYERIVAPINAMKRNTFYLAFLILVIGLTGSVYFSHRLYKPFSSLASRLSTLETEKREHQSIVKRDFLLQFLRNSGTMSAQMVNRQFLHFGIPLSADLPFAAMLIAIDRYAQFRNDFIAGERGLLRYSIANIAEEIVRERFTAEVIEYEEDKILVLLNTEEAAWDAEAVSALALSIQEAVARYLKQTVSIAFSRPMTDSSAVQALVAEMTECAEYRIVYGPRCLIDVGAELRREERAYIFPHTLEQRMLEAWSLGHIEEAKLIVRDIVFQASEHSMLAIQMCLSLLQYSIDNAAHTMLRNAGETNGNSIGRFPHSTQVETLDQAVLQMGELISEVGSRLLARKSNKQLELVQDIQQWIEANYCDPMISPQSVADQFGLSAKYIGRLFKQLTMSAIMDRVMERRIEEAKRLLDETDLPIADIAERIGMTNDSYFYKVFKKETLITPNDYRRRNKEQRDLADNG